MVGNHYAYFDADQNADVSQGDIFHYKKEKEKLM